MGGSTFRPMATIGGSSPFFGTICAAGPGAAGWATSFGAGAGAGDDVSAGCGCVVSGWVALATESDVCWGRASFGEFTGSAIFDRDSSDLCSLCETEGRSPG